MQIGSWWAITGGTLTGPWHVTARGKFWYIINMLTHTTKRIGFMKGRGVNYCDRAKGIARERNAKFLMENKGNLPMYLGLYQEFDKTITEVLGG